MFFLKFKNSLDFKILLADRHGNHWNSTKELLECYCHRDTVNKFLAQKSGFL